MKNFLLITMLLVSIAVQAYEPMIREDRIWQYCIEASYEEGLFPSVVRDTLNFKFDGTEYVNGHTYHILNYWVANAENPKPERVAYMRESCGEVYLLLQQHEIICADVELTLPVPDYTEVLLYSDNKDTNTRNIVALPDWVATEAIDPYTALSLSSVYPVFKTLRKNDKEWKVQIFYKERSEADELLDIDPSIAYDKVVVVEGVGNVGMGFLHMPALLPGVIIIGGQMPKSYFLRQKDLYGNTVFDAKWLKDQSGVTDIVPQERPKDGKSYDLTGKQVNDPEPGTIYIQDGEKRIAR